MKKKVDGNSGGEAALLDVEQVRGVLNCSARHVLRMADRGLMPPPVRLGALVRWQRGAVESWIANGCPAVRRTKEASRVA